LWASEGRSRSTGKRAENAGLEDAGSVARLVEQSDVVLSVCPPESAVDVARAVASRTFHGLYVDGNAVSPGTAREIGRIVSEVGATFVDGGIVGPPPNKPGSTRLYLSGKDAPRIAALFANTPLEAIALDAPPGAASALKNAYASYTKGTSALLFAIRAMAAAEGVDEALLAEWKRSQPDAPGKCDNSARGSSKKAWRFVGEMEELAATYAAVGLPDGFFRSAAEIYGRLASYKDTPTPPSITEVAKTLLAEGAKKPRS
jgi:3-hydroxyisobutyrate dehydrogenase-like beta-hydroxyacid dehydrogenase